MSWSPQPLSTGRSQYEGSQHFISPRPEAPIPEYEPQMLVRPLSGACPTASYVMTRPSCPRVDLGEYALHRVGSEEPCVRPCRDSADQSQIAVDLLHVLEEAYGTLQQHALSPDGWVYDSRHQAQRVLDFLYLGPTSAVRNHDFLTQTGLTLIIVTRDTRLGGRKLASVERASEVTGIPVRYVDVDGMNQMVREYPTVVRLINEHLLEVYRSQASARDPRGRMFPDPKNMKKGKVLVTCETGNDRSAAIVAAYIMSLYGEDLATTKLFIGTQRNSVIFDEDSVRGLLTWRDILLAKSAVARQRESGQTKRRIENVLTEGNGDISLVDEQRFEGRAAFVPFMDLDG